MYPRQLTLLKLIYLETEHFTQYDWDTIGKWSELFKNRTHPIGVQPDIMDRVQYLKAHGYHHFTHVQFVGGRRGSKGVVVGIMGAERLAFLYSVGDWQSYFGFIPGTVAELTVMATSQAQAAKRQFRDVRLAVQGCEYFKRDLKNPRYTDFHIQTPSDRQYIDSCRAQGVAVDPEFSSLYAVASSAVSTSQRGGAGIMNAYDEFAHMLMGTGSTQSGEEIYECLDPNTKVLCADLVWRPIGELSVGDKVVGYDEYPDKIGVGGRRRLRETTVLGVKHQRPGPAFRITFIDGTSVVCSSNHRWLRVNYIANQGGHNGPRWTAIDPVHEPGKRTTRPLRVGDHIKFLVEPWEVDDSHLGGWMAGILDGEGHMLADQSARRIGITQNEGPVLDAIVQGLKDLGFDPRPRSRREGIYVTGEPNGKVCCQIEIFRLEDCLRLLGQLRPVRFMDRHKDLWEGRTIANAQSVKTIASIDRVDDQVLVDIETETGTFVAEGLISHNSQQPSLDQFGVHALTAAVSSPFTMVGKFYELYEEGTVLLDSYLAREGMKKTDELLDIMDDAEDASEADPGMLVCQFPSWELYRDWDRSTEIPLRKGKRNGPPFRNPVQWPPEGDRPENIMQRKRKIKNPEKFGVEREAQFATVQDAYLDPLKVQAMFDRPWWYDEDLVAQDRGRLSVIYRGHGDPSKSNANFGFAICHLENSPCDGCGFIPEENYSIGRAAPHLDKPWDHRCKKKVTDGLGGERPGRIWPFVMVDKLHVWKPENFPGHTLDYEVVGPDIEAMITNFPSMKKLTYDQMNSIGFISRQKRVFPNTRVYEVTFTPKENWNRFEKFKTAMNMGLIKSYRDTLFEDGRSLLELELKFLQEKNGKVDKMDFGPVTTKDLSDAVMVCAVDLLSDHLDRWYNGANLPVFGSTNVAGIKSGRETERLYAQGFAAPTNVPSPTGTRTYSDRGTHNRAMVNDRRDELRARARTGLSARERGLGSRGMRPR